MGSANQSSRKPVQPPSLRTPSNGANLLPIDEAPEVELKPGVRGRYGLCPLSRLAPDPHHARTHPKRQIQKLARSFDVAGPLSPAIVDEGWVILAGHARIEAARQNGASVFPVVQVLGLNEAEKR